MWKLIEEIVVVYVQKVKLETNLKNSELQSFRSQICLDFSIKQPLARSTLHLDCSPFCTTILRRSV